MEKIRYQLQYTSFFKVVSSTYVLKVREAAEALVSGVIAMACGSYRRGRQTCGDVDVLITHPDGKSHKGIFNKLLNNLRETGKHPMVITHTPVVWESKPTPIVVVNAE